MHGAQTSGELPVKKKTKNKKNNNNNKKEVPCLLMGKATVMYSAS